MDMFAAQNRAKLYTLFSAFGIALFLLGVSLGFQAGADTPPPSPAQPPAEAAAPQTPPPSAEPVAAARVDAIGQAGIHPQADVVIETAFGSCGHICSRQGEGVVGCTQSDLNERFPDYAIEEFNKDKVVLRQQKPGYCPAHLILTMAEGKTVIMQTDAQTLQSERIIDPAWDISGADAALVKQLEAGIAFDELAQIDEFIENLES
ncbi:MAG: hypothetical protein PHC80_04695 [Eubacteriales bacterium]|nr:hypothetical protein [Eubacteriales bacterium]